MSKIAIVNTSCLIALSNLDMLDILCKIYDEIVIPKSVLKEFGEINFNCLKVEKVDNSIVELLVNQLNLGRGESEVIALSFATRNVAIIDDQKAREVAKRMNIKITGTIGLILKSEQIGLIISAYKKVLELKNKGFYVSDVLLKEIKEREVKI